MLICDRWRQIAKRVWHAPDHICAGFEGDNLVLDHLKVLKKKYAERVKILFDCSTRDALLCIAQNGLDGRGQISDKESGERFQKTLERMCSDLVEAIPDVGLYIFTHRMDSPGYDDDLLTLHCLFNNEFMYRHSEEGVTPAHYCRQSMIWPDLQYFRLYYRLSRR